MTMVVAVLIILMLEVNRGMGLLFSFVMYIMTLSVSGQYVSSVVGK
jgi:hypothetical protein